jgi:hypothetical protein
MTPAVMNTIKLLYSKGCPSAMVSTVLGWTSCARTGPVSEGDIQTSELQVEGTDRPSSTGGSRSHGLSLKCTTPMKPLGGSALLGLFSYQIH